MEISEKKNESAFEKYGLDEKLFNFIKNGGASREGWVVIFDRPEDKERYPFIDGIVFPTEEAAKSFITDPATPFATRKVKVSIGLCDELVDSMLKNAKQCHCECKEE